MRILIYYFLLFSVLLSNSGLSANIFNELFQAKLSAEEKKRLRFVVHPFVNYTEEEKRRYDYLSRSLSSGIIERLAETYAHVDLRKGDDYKKLKAFLRKEGDVYSNYYKTLTPRGQTNEHDTILARKFADALKLDFMVYGYYTADPEDDSFSVKAFFYGKKENEVYIIKKFYPEITGGVFSFVDDVVLFADEVTPQIAATPSRLFFTGKFWSAQNFHLHLGLTAGANLTLPSLGYPLPISYSIRPAYSVKGHFRFASKFIFPEYIAPQMELALDSIQYTSTIVRFQSTIALQTIGIGLFLRPQIPLDKRKQFHLFFTAGGGISTPIAATANDSGEAVRNILPSVSKLFSYAAGGIGATFGLNLYGLTASIEARYKYTVPNISLARDESSQPSQVIVLAGIEYRI